MKLSEEARMIWEAGIAAVDPARLVGRAVVRDGPVLRIQDRSYDLDSFENIFLIAFGKAAPAMAAAFLEASGVRVRDGLVVALPASDVRFPGMRVVEAPHPLPDRRSVAAAEAALELARRAGERDLVVVLISGGGSAQLCAPAEGLPLEDKIAVTRELLRRGADIFEINAVRKHLSAVKGGRLARAAAPAAVITLAVSDVPGDDLGTIASGPAFWDESSFEDAALVLEKFGLFTDGPPSARRVVEEGRRGLRAETPRKGDPAFRKMTSHLIGTNAAAVAAAAEAARARGFRIVRMPSPDTGEARDAARRWASILRSAASARGGAGALGFIGGGELTVTVKGTGKGGRNQEFVLAALEVLEGWGFGEDAGRAGRDWLVASLGTDGIDGVTDAAGAWAEPETSAAARRLGLRAADYLDENDAYHFFEKAGGLIVTGPTGTNVMDLRLMLLGGPSRRPPSP
ncbi:MAG: DUF4147 domain-containing protein [Candidatus Aminicenantes bacterium]|nr:DUF4147 domain-containing protein [Candidatus Aminicenantes bacterium]